MTKLIFLRVPPVELPLEITSSISIFAALDYSTPERYEVGSRCRLHFQGSYLIRIHSSSQETQIDIDFAELTSLF